MPRQRAASTASSIPPGQEMASMYDYLAKIILLGPSASGKSCVLHRFVNSSWRTLTSQTIGVEFASKIVKVGPSRRVKLQLWDTAGTERFRSVSRSYYRGAAGAVLVYDVSDARSFAGLQTFLNDARALASPQLSVLLVGNKMDLAEPGRYAVEADEPEEDVVGSLPSFMAPSGQRATVSDGGRAVPKSVAAEWASRNRIPATMEVSALSGEGVEEIFTKLASIILTKIELGEIDPDDSLSGIQYGDADYYRYDDGLSVKSGLTSGSVRKRRKRGGLGEWGEVFKVGRPSSSGGGGGRCC